MMAKTTVETKSTSQLTNIFQANARANVIEWVGRTSDIISPQGRSHQWQDEKPASSCQRRKRSTLRTVSLGHE